MDPQLMELLGMLGMGGGFEQILMSPIFRAQLMTQAGGRPLETLGQLAPGLSAGPGTQSIPMAPGTNMPISPQVLLALLMGMGRPDRQGMMMPTQSGAGQSMFEGNLPRPVPGLT